MVAPGGLVSGVIPFSAVDGPGNRFVVFLQGCNFDCVACHNPHTIAVCDHCGVCLDACASGALTRVGCVTRVGGVVRWDQAACAGCDRCLAACPRNSTPKAGWRSVADLVALVRGPAPFLSGVTVSGGEVTLQASFVRAFFETLQGDARLGRLTCFVDSNGAAPARIWDELEPVLDGAMIDLKAFDHDAHWRLTGQSNELVLDTIERLAACGKLHEVRLLMVPGWNDAPEQLARAAAWLRGVDPGMRVKLIGFRRHGVRPAARTLPEPSVENMVGYADVLRSEGLTRLVAV